MTSTKDYVDDDDHFDGHAVVDDDDDDDGNDVCVMHGGRTRQPYRDI